MLCRELSTAGRRLSTAGRRRGRVKRILASYRSDGSRCQGGVARAPCPAPAAGVQPRHGKIDLADRLNQRKEVGIRAIDLSATGVDDLRADASVGKRHQLRDLLAAVVVIEGTKAKAA